MKNAELAEIFEKIADALEFKGELPFKVNAYRKVARILRDLPEDITDIYRRGELRSVPGIGEGIAKKIAEYIETGKMRKYEEAMQGVPPDLLKLMEVPGLGPKTLKLVYEKLGVKTRQDLERVLKDGSLEKLPGMGKKKVDNIKKGLEFFDRSRGRIPLGIALPLVEDLIEYLKQYPVTNISPAGSLRRMKETVGDIDILVTYENGEELIDHFVKYPRVERILAQGSTKGSIIVKGGYQVDLRVVPKESFGAALQYFTGSKPHNIKLRTIARARGWKISEYGVFEGDKKIAGVTEEEVYGALNLPWIPPEMREDRGEVELAQQGKLPQIIGYDDLKGDTHIHTPYSDGVSSIAELVAHAKQLGYEYIVLADHSHIPRSDRNFTLEMLTKRRKECEPLESQYNIKIFQSLEVDINRDGDLMVDSKVLDALDFAIAAVHIFPKDFDMTPAIIKAIRHPKIKILAHPRGRLISKREGYRVDLDHVMQVAREEGVILEINAYYDRLDLTDIDAMRAKELGIKMVIGSDAHNVGMMNHIRFGIGVARRAWLTKADVINTLPLKEFTSFVMG
ncbi:DNA polymerase/3'-5' exonuclease PolX [candidate division WOR-3 bacterium]|nr:DNA polymerase/3'-5' exonuclease PolX [candidate division WOR-3 bacterium]